MLGEILVVVDVPLLRSALSVVLAREPDITGVTCRRSSEITPDTVLEVKPDVAVVDLDIRRPTALSAVHLIAEHWPECRILILAGGGAIPGLRRALAMNVHGFLHRDCDVGELTEAIRRVAAGERFIEPGVALAAVRSSRNPLTGRELDVLRLAADGLTAPEIARALFLTAGTVRNYLSVAVRKVGARSRVEAIRIAAEANWL